MKAKYLKAGDQFKFSEKQSKWNVVTSITHFHVDSVNTRKGDVLLGYKAGKNINGTQCFSGDMDVVIPKNVRKSLECLSQLKALDSLLASRKLQRIELLEEVNRVAGKLEIIETDLQELEIQMLADIEERAKRSSMIPSGNDTADFIRLTALDDESPDETQALIDRYCPGLKY